MNKPLGRRIPTDFEHVEKYPLKAITPTVALPPAPVVWGINWYSNFDNPRKDRDGKYWIGRGNLGSLRGGHAICSPHKTTKDVLAWWDFYNQGQEGSCVGFSSSRMMSLLNRKRYDARWLYHEAQNVDEWQDTPPEEGTSVRAAMDVLRLQGHKAVRGKKTYPIEESEGIQENRWATTFDEVLETLANQTYKTLGAVPFLNSWGRYYPHITWMSGEIWQRLLNEYGESTRITDR